VYGKRAFDVFLFVFVLTIFLAVGLYYAHSIMTDMQVEVLFFHSLTRIVDQDGMIVSEIPHESVPTLTLMNRPYHVGIGLVHSFSRHISFVSVFFVHH
jgi:hypothetical protein